MHGRQRKIATDSDWQNCAFTNTTTSMNRSIATGLLLLLTILLLGQSATAQDVFTLAESGDVAAMAKLLKKKPKLAQATREDGSTPLFHAVYANDTAMAALLLRNRANVNHTAHVGTTPLHVALSAEMAELLLAAGANVNHADGLGNTPLHNACRWGDYDLALRQSSVLLQHNATVNAQDIAGHTPLWLAVDGNNSDVVQQLLGVDADPNIPDDAGRTPIFVAVQLENVEITQTLIAAGAYIDIEDAKAITLMQTVKETRNVELMNVIVAALRQQGIFPKDPEQPNEHPEQPTDEPEEARLPEDLLTPIAFSLGAYGSIDELKQLIAKDPEDVSVNGPAYILLAEDRRDAIALLRDNGAQVNYPAGTIGTTALHRAAAAGDIPLAELLLEGSTDINAPANMLADDGATPLHLAAAAGQTEMVRFLLNHDANPNIEAKRNGITPLHAAAENGGIEMVQLLIERGADVNAHNSTGESSPLHYAAQGNKVDIVRYLLDHSATIDPADLRKQTPLFWAVRNNSLDAARLLLERGANPLAVDWNNQTVIDYARQEKKEEFVEIMKDE